MANRVTLRAWRHFGTVMVGAVALSIFCGTKSQAIVVILGCNADGDCVSPTDFCNTNLPQPPDWTGSCATVPTLTPTRTPTQVPTSTPAAGCSAVPSETCYTAAKSVLLLKYGTDSTKRNFAWKWLKGNTSLEKSDFGDPESGSTSYRLCLYDQTGGSPVLKMGTTVANGGTCGTKPCWKEVADIAWSYKDRLGSADGITRLLAKAGPAGKSKVLVKGKGSNLHFPAPVSPTEVFDQDTSVIVQMHRNDVATCWSSTFAASATKANKPTVFKAIAR